MSWQVLVENTVTGLGYELVDVARSARGLLQVFIDHPWDPAAPERFITVEDCEQVTRQLQYLLEVEGVPYERLEVSSPGLDRPLRRERDYERFVGQDIEITLKLVFQGRKKYRGLLQAGAEPGEWTLLFQEGKAEQVLGFRLEEVREASLVPVINFKGRSSPAAAPTTNNEDQA